MENKSTWEKYSAAQVKACHEFCKGYLDFLSNGKTERECVEIILEEMKAAGYKDLDELIARGKKLKAGDKVYRINMKKGIAMFNIGKEPIENGMNILGAHIDSPRMDVKQNPLYEDGGFALLDTHYYGGIKKYQWTVTPLALHGVIVKKDGETVKVKVGEDDGDPKFVVTDLLPHLAASQMKSTMAEGVKGENLNVLIGSRPFDDTDAAENVKLNIMNILFEKYGINEADFLSAELEVVPAFRACDIGFDRSMIGAYGHDDRVCAYPALMALIDAETPEYTSLCVLADKEEIGSVGNTGLDSSFLNYFVCDLAEAHGLDGRDVLSRSQCLSADVNAAFDPIYPEVSEKRNASFVNRGCVITKYTGSRGKGGTSDASAEFMAKIRALLDGSGVVWQTGELGKVDEGGGGTVAKYVAGLNVDTVDLGVPVLSMHAPFEVVSKLDVYMTYKACYAFYMN